MLTSSPDLLGRLAERQNRSPITMPGYHKGQRPANYGLKLPPEVLTREEIERLLRVMGRGPTAQRNRALVVVLWRCALRISEALALCPKDIGRVPPYPTVTVLRGKGGRSRQVAIDTYALALVDRWLETRRKIGIGESRPLFCVVDRRTRGKPLHSAYVREMLKMRAGQAGIAKRVHPHGLRHTRAFELIMDDTPLPVIKDHLGHSQLATTMRYCDHLAPGASIKWVHEHSNLVETLESPA